MLDIIIQNHFAQHNVSKIFIQQYIHHKATIILILHAKLGSFDNISQFRGLYQFLFFVWSYFIWLKLYIPSYLSLILDKCIQYLTNQRTSKIAQQQHCKQHPQMTTIQHKRDSFHKEIRSKVRKDYFQTQRQLLFINTFRTLSPDNNLCASIQTNQQLCQLLTNDSTIDFFRISQYLASQISGLDKQIQFKVFELLLDIRNLSNQHALIMGIHLLKMKDLSSELLQKYQQYFGWIIENVIKENIVHNNDSFEEKEQNQQHNFTSSGDSLNFFSTVNWFLFTLSLAIKDNSYFISLKNYMGLLENNYPQFNLQFLALASQLSSYPQLLPSLDFINQILKYSPCELKDQSDHFIQVIVNLIDNFLRYSSQLNRFQKEESLDLHLNYLTFINRGLNENRFPVKSKIKLTQLFTSLIKSSQGEAKQLLKTTQFTQIIGGIYFRSLINYRQTKITSLTNLCQLMLCGQVILSEIQVILSRAKIAHLLIESLSLHDRDIQSLILSTIFSLININENGSRYKQEFEMNKRLSHKLSELRDGLPESNDSLPLRFLREQQSNQLWVISRSGLRIIPTNNISLSTSSVKFFQLEQIKHVET